MREIENGEESHWFKTSVVDAESIDHECQIGAVKVTGDIIRIRVAQRIDFDLLAEPVAIRPSLARINLGETFEMDASQAIEISDRLRDAASFAKHINGMAQRPRLIAEG
ncbi:hypothetical protein GCM10022223_62790 [Kineosporia mesophila]|uniref:Uncharacterized protein n=1 Tax=Kineosporia mesophila TaxID=566012 RepID=A0ABP7AMQ6_9ACTN|nr:hypothetical protein [Kineosporia mesophila]MCD5354545.1 hypothetical protein [Kineosporia mesophila]